MLAYVDMCGQLLSSSHSSSSHWPLTTCCRFSQTAWVVENIIFSPSFNLSPIFYVHHCSSLFIICVATSFARSRQICYICAKNFPKTVSIWANTHVASQADLEIQLGTWTCSSMKFRNNLEIFQDWKQETAGNHLGMQRWKDHERQRKATPSRHKATCGAVHRLHRLHRARDLRSWLCRIWSNTQSDEWRVTSDDISNHTLHSTEICWNTEFKRVDDNSEEFYAWHYSFYRNSENLTEILFIFTSLWKVEKMAVLQDATKFNQAWRWQMKTDENRWKQMKTDENRWKQMKTDENRWKQMKTDENDKIPSS